MMEIDVIQLEVVKKGSVILEGQDERTAYGIESVKELFWRQIGKSNVEMVGLVCLDVANRIINYSNVSIGDINCVKVSLAQIFRVALLSNASQIIVAHNHPSGVLEVTNTDILVTKQIGSIARLLDIKLIDSLIINMDGQIISIRENMRELRDE